MALCDPHWDVLIHAVVKVEGEVSAESDNAQAAEEALAQYATETITPAIFNFPFAVYYTLCDELARIQGIAVAYRDGCPICNADKIHADECQVEGCEFTTFAAMLDPICTNIAGSLAAAT